MWAGTPAIGLRPVSHSPGRATLVSDLKPNRRKENDNSRDVTHRKCPDWLLANLSGITLNCSLDFVQITDFFTAA